MVMKSDAVSESPSRYDAGVDYEHDHPMDIQPSQLGGGQLSTLRSLFDAFLTQVQRRPQSLALIAETSPGDGAPSVIRRLRWRELADVVRWAMLRLEGDFARRPDLPRRIGHTSDNRLADVVLAIACMGTRAMEVPFDHREADRIEPRWRRIGGLWVDQPWKSRLESICFAAPESTGHWRRSAGDWHRARLHPAEDPALVLWTSGTTEQPKGVTLSHRNLLGNAAAKGMAVPQHPSDRRLTSLPLCHAYARTSDLGTWLLSGCTLAVTLGFEGWRRLAPEVRPTLANTVPSLADRLLAEDPAEFGLDQLRLLGCGGAAMFPAAFHAWSKRGVTVIQGYGLSEAAPVVCSATPDNALPGLVGQPVEGWETKILDGRLFVRGEHTMLGYWESPEATAAKIDDAGWLDTGDLAEIDAPSGQFRILGRADEVLVLSNGRNVHPAPLERALAAVPGVRHAVVVSEGQLAAWLNLEPEVELDHHLCRQLDAAVCHVAHWQRPRNYHRFDPPLSIAGGELTAKGTVCRGAILRRIGRHRRADLSVMMGDT